MMNRKIYKSDAFRAIHEGAVDMYEVVGISEARMKEFDEMCFIPEVLHVSRTARDVPARRLSPVAAPAHR
jgi:DNA-binding transcriptional regulator YiaG